MNEWWTAKIANVNGYGSAGFDPWAQIFIAAEHQWGSTLSKALYNIMFSQNTNKKLH